jgi:hypothetical protein
MRVSVGVDTRAGGHTHNTLAVTRPSELVIVFAGCAVCRPRFIEALAAAPPKEPYPRMIDYLCDACRAQAESLLRGLDHQGIPYCVRESTTGGRP